MKENLKKIAICLRDFVKDWGGGVVVGGGGVVKGLPDCND